MTEHHLGRSRRALARRQLYAACLLGLASVGGTGAVHAQSSETPRAYAIEAGTLEAALNQLSRQSQVQIVFPPELVVGKRAGALSGQLTWREALGRLLQGSGLEYRQVADKTIVIQKLEVRPAPATQSNGASKPETHPAARTEPQAKDIERMTVTGTRIRGGATPSPVISIDAAQIQEEGFADLGQVIRAVPQNFGGGQNPGVASGAGLGGVSNQNITGGAALNLRGLGPDATLTLVNGRRLAYGGYSQAVDISSIPVEAVERIEIVPDGASAIYGSDAVGGVANVILKRDFAGWALGTRYGSATGAGLTTRDYSVTAGTTWASGGVITTWKKSSSDAIMADQRRYTEGMDDPTTLYPALESSSGLVSAYQALGDVAELRLDSIKVHREQEKLFGYPDFYYYYPYEVASWLISPSIEFNLPGDWSLTVGGTYGSDETESDAYYVEASESMLAGSQCYCNDSRSYEVDAEGPLFPLGGGDARLAVGAGARSDKFETSTSAGLIAGEERARYFYGELSMPFVSPASARAGIHRLEFSAAFRHEDYDSYGSVGTPKLGLIYDPSADVTVRASWGKSFKAPTLLQRSETKSAYLWTAGQVGGSDYPADATVLMSYGGNADLDAERARTRTASLAIHPVRFPKLEMELAWFDIDYVDRVAVPLNHIQALSNPIYLNTPFVDLTPTGEEQDALLAVYNDAFINFTGSDYDPSTVVAILSNQYVNVARQKIRGIDLSGSYRFALSDGELTVRGSASRLASSQQTTEGQPTFDLAGMIFNPAKYKSRLGAVWSRGGFSASGFVNYASGVTSTLVAGSREEIGSFTTIDTTLLYDVSPSASALSSVQVALSVDNLLDRDPPLYTVTSLANPPYDSTNYSAIGRFWSVSVAMHW